MKSDRKQRLTYVRDVRPKGYLKVWVRFPIPNAVSRRFSSAIINRLVTYGLV